MTDTLNNDANCGSAVLNTIVATLQTGSITRTQDRIDLEIDQAASVVRLHAISTGSTCKADFVVKRLDSRQFTATRIKSDLSRRKPFQVTFEYSFAELSLIQDDHGGGQRVDAR